MATGWSRPLTLNAVEEGRSGVVVDGQLEVLAPHLRPEHVDDAPGSRQVGGQQSVEDVACDILQHVSSLGSGRVVELDVLVEVEVLAEGLGGERVCPSLDGDRAGEGERATRVRSVSSRSTPSISPSPVSRHSSRLTSATVVKSGSTVMLRQLV